MKITQLVREFSYASLSLPDPGSHLSLERVKNIYSRSYPELATASIDGPETRNGKMIFTFKRSVGTKG
jgi:PRTRC genetic system protein C